MENIGVINNTCKLSQIERVSPKNIDFEDDAVWDSMRKDTALIFQMNSDYGQRTMNKIFSDEVYAKIKKEIPSMTKLDLLAFACALVRPCGKGVYEKATSGVVSKTGIKDIDDLLGPSMGYAIMQEPQMAFVQKFCGYTFLESDKLRKCVARGEKVLMGDGSLKNIEDVKVGDIVATKDGNKISTRPVTSWANNGVKNTVVVKVGYGFSLRCTKDHRILTQRGYIEARYLSTEDFAFIPDISKGNFITQRVMDIQDSEECETYDIEVEQTHNFICEGIVVHNCISKKLGTREQLPKIKSAWEQNAKIRYNLTDEQSEAIIEPFLQCILDATRYSFSLVHSLSYSCISYECGWLRYHYPLEYITSCLNTWNGNDEKTAEAIEYATKKGIRILLPKFRHSKADYFFDKETNSIYRGTSSIKGISASYAEALYELRDREYNSFIELLYDIQAIGVPKDQIEALIKLDYFEEFGTIKELSLIYYQFQCFKKGEAKTISKDKLTDKIIYDIVARNANETAKQFNKINCQNILIEIEQYIKSLGLGDADIKTKIQNQMDYMGYIGIKTDKLEDRPRIIVLSIRVLKSAKTNKPWAISMDGQSIGSAKRANYTIRYSLYEKEQFNKCDIIRIKDWERDKRGYYWITNFVKEIC